MAVRGCEYYHATKQMRGQTTRIDRQQKDEQQRVKNKINGGKEKMNE